MKTNTIIYKYTLPPLAFTVLHLVHSVAGITRAHVVTLSVYAVLLVSRTCTFILALVDICDGERERGSGRGVR